MDIRDFKYGWRFTDEKYALFSFDELQNMCVISREDTLQKWNAVCDKEVLEKCSVVSRMTVGNAPLFFEKDCGWGEAKAEFQTGEKLRNFCDGQNVDCVSILYDRETAINVSTELFCTKWSDFCYPSDVLLILCGTQALLYYEDTMYGPIVLKDFRKECL